MNTPQKAPQKAPLNTPRNTPWHKRSLLLLLFVTAASFLGRQAQAQVVIIANPRIAPSEISSADLRDVFSGAITSLPATPRVVPILLRDGPAHEQMLTLYIGKSDAAFRATWRSLVFSGQGAMPRSLDSEAAIVEFVAHTPGAIGYIGKATPHEGVKVLSIH